MPKYKHLNNHAMLKLLDRRDAEIAGLRQALQDIAEPLAALEREAADNGAQLSPSAPMVVENSHYLRAEARAALEVVYE